jgi:hypothetical protein
MRARAKDYLVALSLANLCFIRVWPDLLNSLWADTYYLKREPYLTDAGTVVLSVLIIATLFYVAVSLARRARHAALLDVTRWIFLVVLLVPLNGIRLEFPVLYASTLSDLFGEKAMIGIISLVALFTLHLLRRRYRAVVHIAKILLLILSPFILYTFTRVLWPPISHVHANINDKTPAPSLPVSKTTKQRILILIFDELDEDAIFAERPPTVKLPEFDRFLQHALHATSVTSVADVTLKAMPALITGKQVTDAQPAGPDELLISYPGVGKPVPWSQQPNIFTKARKYGVNTALLGWYHPYCRILGHVLNYCSWEPSETRYGTRINASWQEKLTWFGVLVDTIPLANRFELRRHIEETFQIRLATKFETAQLYVPRYLRMLHEAEKLVADPSFGLILIHWPIPHPPPIYDRDKNDFLWEGRGSYLDNLALADQTLGTLRARMEESGSWENTAVLITSDHPYRDSWKPVWTEQEKEEMHRLDGKIGRRVPFLLKSPNQKVSIVYDRPLSNLIINDLVTALFSANLPANPENMVDWLSRHPNLSGAN